jgi:hypothetical protein
MDCLTSPYRRSANPVSVGISLMTPSPLSTTPIAPPRDGVVSVDGYELAQDPLPVPGFRNPDFDAAFTHRQSGKRDAALPQYSIQIVTQFRHHGFAQCIGVDLEQNAGSALLLDSLVCIGGNRRA